MTNTLHTLSLCLFEPPASETIFALTPAHLSFPVDLRLLDLVTRLADRYPAPLDQYDYGPGPKYAYELKKLAWPTRDLIITGTSIDRGAGLTINPQARLLILHITLDDLHQPGHTPIQP